MTPFRWPDAVALRPGLVALALSALGLLAACAAASGQPPADADSAVGCPDVTRLNAAQLYGSWALELPGVGQRGSLSLRQHPEFSASLRGEFSYGGHRSIASGDVEEGEFHLDESRDGKRFFAFWSGRLVPEACGAEIRGHWETVPREGEPAQQSPFVLRRAQGLPGR
ncbi:MAG: hypothetical protein Q4G71_09210 [Pseudomonadota bacterium]|nr:hypothetical protein [Pseudomonadota bacterium]